VLFSGRKRIREVAKGYGFQHYLMVEGACLGPGVQRLRDRGRAHHQALPARPRTAHLPSQLPHCFPLQICT
jgi:hypothetical protein